MNAAEVRIGLSAPGAIVIDTANLPALAPDREIRAFATQQVQELDRLAQIGWTRMDIELRGPHATAVIPLLVQGLKDLDHYPVLFVTED
ncbi:hypothetical protein OG357_25690 [Streptomyces sp. NBC_01255]|uniref:hypothetical protein n=1 Tax=Streptomyces sp. NBC_01255 TaxID=2903798 RepID=UPI002E3664CE|nr:hypothetical protein [Streptomyces sp. NBC_01255]